MHLLFFITSISYGSILVIVYKVIPDSYMAATEAFEIKTDPVGVDVVTTSDFVVPQREILKCFDVNKWFYSKVTMYSTKNSVKCW